MLFPEGTRTRNGRIGKGKPGPGMVIQKARPVVIPVAISGMNQVLPVGSLIPRPFKKVKLTYGKPVDLEDLYLLPNSKETSQLMIDRIMVEINRLYDQLENSSIRKAA